MAHIYIIALFLCLSLYFYLVGHAVKTLFKLQMEHMLILGIFTYIIAFGIVSTPLAVLNVHWNIFFYAVSLLNIVFLGAALYILHRNNAWPKWSLSRIREYIISNWPVIVFVLLFFTLFLMSDYSFVWYGNHGAIFDHSYYAAKANEAINNPHILLNNPKFGTPEEPTAKLVNSVVTWELLWSYLSAVTGLTVNQVSKLLLPPFIYIGIFFTFEAIMKDLFKYKKGIKYYRGYLFVFLVYIFYTTLNGDLQGELKKLLYFIWYGNVQVTILFVITTFYFFQRSLTNKNWIWVIVLQLLYYSVFSSGAWMYAGLIYPIFIIYWALKKNYRFKFDYILGLIAILFFVGLNYFYIKSQASVPEIEKDIWINHLHLSLPIFLTACGGIAVLQYKKCLSDSEMYFVWFLMIMIGLMLLEPTSTRIFLAYRFALHRYGVSLMFTLLIFGSIGISHLWKSNTKLLLWLVLPGMIIAQKNYDFYLVQNRYALVPEHIFNVNRESDEVVDIAKFLNSKAKTKSVKYCTYSNLGSIAPTLIHQYRTNSKDYFLNIGRMIATETRNVYESVTKEGTLYKSIEVENLVDSDCDYLITDSLTLKNHFERAGAEVQHKTEKSKVLYYDIYIIDISKL